MNKDINVDLTSEEKFEDRNRVEILRNDFEKIQVGDKEVGKITGYKYTILIHNKPTLSGTLSREDVEKMYKLYSSEGGNLTQKTVSREFPEYTFRDFKRILKALNITKASAPLAPHIVEEKPLEELVALTNQIKENTFLKRLEQEKYKTLEKQLKESTKKCLELEEQLKSVSDIVSSNTKVVPYTPNKKKAEGLPSLILHLSDMHIGAKVSPDSLFSNHYDVEVVKARLQSILNKLSGKKFDTIVINLLGDNIDGINQTTARPSSSHLLPQNLDNYEQVRAYLEILEWFVVSLHKMEICNHMKFYSVKCGNHDGVVSWIATTALFSKLQLLFPFYDYKIFEEFFGYYEFCGMKWVITHGKDDLYMKSGMGLNISPREKIQLYSWLDSKGIYGNNIHVIKGDLHSDNLNSCKKMDYRNCLSLFGASDHSNFNYELNDYGVSYEVIDNGELMRGTFINL